jgi:hypothetical protein
VISKHRIRAAAAAIAVCLTVGTPMAVAVATAPPAAAGAVVCGFLNDGGGSGSAASVTPGKDPSGGEQFTQQNDSDAWRTCLNLSDHHLYLFSATSWCASNNSNSAKLRSCDLTFTHTDQKWFEANVNPNTGAFNLQNDNGGWLCANGGVNSNDLVVAALSDCSNYHETWHFS